MNIYNYQIAPDLAGARLDKALSSLMPSASRSRVQKAIKEAHVKLNNVIISDSDYKVKENDLIEITLMDPETLEIEQADIPLDIIFEDDDIIVINKPVGLTVHPGAGNHQNTLVNALIYYSCTLSDVGGDARPGIVHRLDKDTSGLMIIAKTNEAHVIVAAQIERRELIRKYKALVWGVLNPTRGRIENNIGRDRISRQKMAVVKSGGKIAITDYQTEAIFLNGALSLIECKLNTGRTHQIRVHMSHKGHSIIGDQTYGKNNRKAKTLSLDVQNTIADFKRQALHSYYLGFIHPTSNKFLEFTIDLPLDIIKIIDCLKNHQK